MQREHVAQPVTRYIQAHADILDGGDFSPRGLERCGEVAHFEQAHCWILKRGCRESTSRSPSPDTFRPMLTSSMAVISPRAVWNAVVRSRTSSRLIAGFSSVDAERARRAARHPIHSGPC